MRARGIATALAFDQDFVDERFRISPPRGRLDPMVHRPVA